ncbi:hypothetical protein EMPS_00195 [Entomortierella parvispora]|uniref:magnesium chelatase n=1 Tax=Entomortierella parvispora TaxID=205924 RepID=A0A9P3GZQ6_9FUNG|nr:hypothetical protein EMPS_00195 [Entomortierella parvispora]
MAPANRAWIRGRMAAIKKTSGIAFSEEIFLSILICLVAKGKHLVLHTTPEILPELKSVVEQHCATVFGLTTATIVCHGQQTRADIIAAISGRHADIHTNSSTPSAQYQLPGSVHHHLLNHSHHHNQGHPHHQHHQHNQASSSNHYQHYTDDNTQRGGTRQRTERSRRSIATSHSEASDYSVRPSETMTPSIISFKTASERDPMDAGSIHMRTSRRSQQLSYFTPTASSTSTQLQQQYSAGTSVGGGAGGAGAGGGSGLGGYLNTNNGAPGTSNSQTPVTPVDFTFPRRRHESVSIAGTGGGMEEASGVTYGGRRIAQAIILDGLENASQEIFAVIMEMIITREINDRNRYVFPDLIVIAVFNSPTVPDNIPKQLLDYFAINGSYYFSTPQPKPQSVPNRRHALFRRTDWDELSKRMKTVTVANDMTRYIRDVIVAIRTHEAVHGGLTARAALDLEAIMKTLAAIFQSKFVTPELLTIAAEKVFSHRLQLKSARIRRIQQGREHGENSPPSHPSSVSRRSSDNFSESSRQSSSEEQDGQDATTAMDVVQDVLKVVFPPI